MCVLLVIFFPARSSSAVPLVDSTAQFKYASLHARTATASNRHPYGDEHQLLLFLSSFFCSPLPVVLNLSQTFTLGKVCLVLYGGIYTGWALYSLLAILGSFAGSFRTIYRLLSLLCIKCMCLERYYENPGRRRGRALSEDRECATAKHSQERRLITNIYVIYLINTVYPFSIYRRLIARRRRKV